MQLRKPGKEGLEETLGAVEIALGENEIATLSDILPTGAAAGGRYSEAGMATLNH